MMMEVVVVVKRWRWVKGLDLPVTRRATKLIPEYEVCGPNLRSVSFFSSFSVGVHNFFPTGNVWVTFLFKK